MSKPEFSYKLPSQDEEIKKLSENLVRFLEDKKLKDIKLINLEKVNPYFCFFIIATANSTLQLKTVSREIYKNFYQYIAQKKSISNDEESGWIILDFIDIVLHLFLEEQRIYYNLEKLWGDAQVIYSSDIKTFQW